jgi:hypothetical protein
MILITVSLTLLILISDGYMLSHDTKFCSRSSHNTFFLNRKEYFETKCKNDPKFHYHAQSSPDTLSNNNKNSVYNKVHMIFKSCLLPLLSATITPSVVNSVTVLDPPPPSPRPLVYSVEFTSPPSLQPRSKRGEIGAAKRIALNDIVIMGSHKDISDPKYNDRELEVVVRSYLLLLILLLL